MADPLRSQEGQSGTLTLDLDREPDEREGRVHVAVTWVGRVKVDLETSWDEGQLRRAWDVISEKPVQKGEFWNVNFPHPEGRGSSQDPDLVHCEPSRKPLPVSFRRDGNGNYFYTGLYLERQREPDSDVSHCFAGRITLSKLRV